MKEDLVIKLDTVSRPDDDLAAHMGPRRLVKLVPYGPNVSAPAIWTSGLRREAIDEGSDKIVCRKCIVLIQKDPPLTTAITIPADFYDQLPEMPIEW